jgi:hypothetical protein
MATETALAPSWWLQARAEEIGRGGMATIVRGTDVMLHRVLGWVLFITFFVSLFRTWLGSFEWIKRKWEWRPPSDEELRLGVSGRF